MKVQSVVVPADSTEKKRTYLTAFQRFTKIQTFTKSIPAEWHEVFRTAGDFRAAPRDVDFLT